MKPEQAGVATKAAPLLEVTDLKKHFPIRKGILSRTVGHVYADGPQWRGHARSKMWGEQKIREDEREEARATYQRAIAHYEAIAAESP